MSNCVLDVTRDNLASFAAAAAAAAGKQPRQQMPLPAAWQVFVELQGYAVPQGNAAPTHSVVQQRKCSDSFAPVQLGIGDIQLV